VRNPDGAIVGVLGIGWDVTDQRAVEAQVRHVHKMDAIGQLAGGIAHDFNNLLTIMLGNLSFALKDNTDLGTVLDLVRNAEKAGLRAAELTKTLLGFSHQAALTATPLDVQPILDEVLTLMRPTLPANITVEIRRQNEPWLVQADPRLMHQMLTNLTLNARDAMPQGGKITYEVSHFVPDADYLARHVEARAGEFVHLRVQDTGLGIAPEARQRIFEPFFTTKDKAKGTGLGLAIVFGIVKQHGGWIVCASEPGRGATFDLFLPRCQTSAPATIEPAPAPAAKQPLILLVDDEKMIRQLTKTILNKAGFEVVLAENGETAIELYRERHAEIALVILDAVMPRLSGRDTLRALTKIAPGIPVVFSSGYSNEQVDLNEFPQVRGFLAKPYRAEQLVQKVNEIVRGP
jgi:nitrogen-specific signal transduction histidine kinase/CheY-like chemotaxis protein